MNGYNWSEGLTPEQQAEVEADAIKRLEGNPAATIVTALEDARQAYDEAHLPPMAPPPVIEPLELRAGSADDPNAEIVTGLIIGVKGLTEKDAPPIVSVQGYGLFGKLKATYHPDGDLISVDYRRAGDSPLVLTMLADTEVEPPEYPPFGDEAAKAEAEDLAQVIDLLRKAADQLWRWDRGTAAARLEATFREMTQQQFRTYCEHANWNKDSDGYVECHDCGRTLAAPEDAPDQWRAWNDPRRSEPKPA